MKVASLEKDDLSPPELLVILILLATIEIGGGTIGIAT
jgi:hypothetical protein